MNGATVTLPWPPRACSPNGQHGHWRTRWRAKKQYQEACAWQCRADGVKPIAADRVVVHIEFVKPSRRRMDLDNALASIKSGLDAVSEAIGIDDSKWQISMAFADEIGGFVRIHVREV